MIVYEMPGHLIRRLNQMSTHTFSMAMQAAGFDLTPVQFAALDAIMNHPGIDQAGVAAKIAYDRATIGGVIDRLEKKDYVTREVSQRDRRARELRLTGPGLKIFHQALPIVTSLQDEMLSGLDHTEKTMFLRLAKKLISNSGEPFSSFS